MKAYPDYKNSGFEFIGKIPKHWSLISLKYLLQDGNNGIKIGPFGSSLKLEIIKEDGYKVYGQGNVINNDFTWGHRYIDEDKFQELSVYEIHQDDIIITMMGTTGQAKVVPQNIKQGIFDSHIIRVRVNKKTFPQFISMLINDSYYVYNQVKLNSKGSIMEGLNSSIVKAIQIALPPTPEQQAIADFLDRKTAQIDTLIEKKQRQIDLLQEQRTALINHAVTKGLNPDVRMKDSGVEWLGKIPSHWEMTTVRYFYDVKLGKMLDSNKQNGNDLVKPYLRAANIHWNEILLDEVGVNEMEFSESQLERYALQSGDLLITEGGVTVGRSAIWNGELTECYFQNSLNRARPSKHASTKWLYYWMYFVTNNGFIDILADKSTFGHLTNEKLKALPIPIPPISEHDEIIEKLESYEPKMEAQIVLIEKQIVYLQEYRTALISEAVTGKIDVRTENTVHEYPAGTM